MSPRAAKKTTAAKAPAGKVQWSVRGEGELPGALTGAKDADATDVDQELLQLTESLAYRVLELIPTLQPDEILEAIKGVDDESLQVIVLKKQDGAFGTLDTMDATSWVDGGGPQLVGKMHGAGKYQLRLHGRRNGIRCFIKQPMFQVGGAAAASSSTPATPSAPHRSPLELAKEIAMIVGAVTPFIKEIFGRRSEPAPHADPATMVRLFREGLELGKESVKDKGDDGFGRTLRELLPPAMNTFREIAASSSTPNGAGPVAAPPAVPQLPSGGAAAPPAGPPDPAWVSILRPHVGQLNGLAQVRASAKYWAEQVVPMLTDEQLSFIADQLDRGDDGVAEFFAYFPDAVPYRVWYERFFMELDELMNPDELETPPAGAELLDSRSEPTVQGQSSGLPGFGT